MTYKCIIVEPDSTDANRLVGLLKNHQDIDIVSISNNGERAIDEILSHQPDLIFMAIEMPLKSGIEIVEEIHSKQIYPKFIFVSSFSHYAIPAIRIKAFDYLMKPINIYELNQTLDTFRSNSENFNVICLNKSKICTNLSDREKQILLLILHGISSAEVSEQLFISKSTVNFHRKNILQKTESVSLINLIQKLNPIKYIG